MSGLAFTEIAYPPGTKILPHAHALPYFCVVVRGSYREQYGSQWRENRAFDFLFHPAGEIQSQTFHDGGARCLAVEVQPAFASRMADYLALLSNQGGFQCPATPSLGMALYEEFLCSDHASTLAIEALLLELIAKAVRHRVENRSPDRPAWLSTVIEMLRDRYGEGLSLSQISREVGVHPVTIARLFRKTQHVSIGEFLRRQKVEFACRQLLNSDIPLSRIALEAGFCDQSHFARVFKRVTGMRPTQFALLRKKS